MSDALTNLLSRTTECKPGKGRDALPPGVAYLSESFNSEHCKISCIAFTANHEGPCCQARISWAARPAIMCVDAAVPGPVMICGITEASATRNPETP